jgi:hypothetical protein
MSSKRKQNRDSTGRFTGKEDSEEEAITTVTEKIGFLWRRLKLILFVLTFVVLSIPWSVMVFEPAKNYGNLLMEYAKNMTTDVHYNLCSCPLPQAKPRTEYF